MVAQIDLPLVVPALEIASLVLGGREGREQHRRQNGQNADNDEQLEERETTVRPGSKLGWFPKRIRIGAATGESLAAPADTQTRPQRCLRIGATSPVPGPKNGHLARARAPASI